MAQGHMAGDGSRHDGAFGFEDVPDGTGHGGRHVRLLAAHAFGLGTKLCNVLTHLPVDAHLIHDPVVGWPHIEGRKFRAGHLVQ